MDRFDIPVKVQLYAVRSASTTLYSAAVKYNRSCSRLNFNDRAHEKKATGTTNLYCRPNFITPASTENMLSVKTFA